MTKEQLQARNDLRLMEAAIRLARRNEGLTGTNPSVACLIVRQGEDGPIIVGAGITAPGGRPHAEPIALAEAGDLANGATAYVTLEPCAHHGRTPPCAQTLIDAGVSRVVTAATDPDARVSGLGHAMLRDAGIEVLEGCGAKIAAQVLSNYLIQKRHNRAQVTLKLAVSADGFLGIKGQGQIAITGAAARAHSHLMRARHHAILVGASTAIADDPDLTCRLPGLQSRTPVRTVLDPNGRVPLDANLFTTASRTRTMIAAPGDMDAERRTALEALGVEILNCEIVEGAIALPELLDDLAAIGIRSVLVEGGAMTAGAFIAEDLVDEIALFMGETELAGKSSEDKLVASPLTLEAIPPSFEPVERLALGGDHLTRYKRPV